ncbi:prolipoprotein diacylglyceryl transferase [Massilia yuzhufengensis]|uniref:Phosphatidylglycerol--prolipoprotein diacylglyceryl transferase n=1 Tax=Massilia yuzhufengensis TaxID=1164594 RepID=A0A1I1HH72_9BURK|nr:prolipoprotein diacylglyceryl transferase [Massilia yuzhufengensis]SFC23075.1 phosphatidylglycerol:prolipoprotein diacylglycerol transferase [Massilia yuzhufengensis]
MSYPYLGDVVKALTGYDVPLPLATFGLLVACAMIVAASCLTAELRRMDSLGAILPGRRRVKAKDGVEQWIVKPAHELVSNLTLVVMVTGIVGARVFHILENLDQFFASPWSMIFSRSGLSVFGGLILGTVAGLVYVRRWHLPIRPMLDAVAPAMMLGYAIGRIGCQVSGDGDWGVPANMALKPDWLPTWFWAQTYDNNIYGELIAAPGVYPTPVYESLMAFACFGLLWALRKRPFQAGWLFSVYLLLSGIERLLIEQIRVNPAYHLGSLQATQAELIAVMLMLAGAVGVVLLRARGQALVRRPAGLEAPQR